MFDFAACTAALCERVACWWVACLVVRPSSLCCCPFSALHVHLYSAAALLYYKKAFLIDGMESLSQAKVGSALQVFFNLEQLQQVSKQRSEPT